MSINIERIVKLAETVEVGQDEVEGYTAYAIAGVINETLAALGEDFKVNPQQLYNDSVNGRINGVKAVKGTKVRYTEDEVELYVAKFVAKHMGTGTRVSIETEMPPAEVDLEDIDEDAELDETVDDEN
jgi:hypothetical protein